MSSSSIPTVLESLETLEFLGFTSEAGKRILERFNNSLDLIEDPCILDYAKGQIRSFPDVGCPEDHWNSTMLVMGITQTLCDKILDPEFTNLRLTQNARYWVLDTIEAKFRFLTSLDDANVLGQMQKKQRHPQPQVQPSTTPSQPISATEVVLLKGGDCARLQKAIRLSTDSTDVNRIQNVASAPPGDFAGLEMALYFTQQRQFAYQYASYARTRLRTAPGDDPIPVGILHVVIPKELMTGGVHIDGEIWREFVWNHKLQRPIPEDLRWVDEANVVSGPVVRCSPAEFGKLVRGGMGYRALELLEVAGGELASQCSFKGANLMRKINQEGRFRIEILS